jgi:hypothetical protein
VSLIVRPLHKSLLGKSVTVPSLGVPKATGCKGVPAKRHCMVTNSDEKHADIVDKKKNATDSDSEDELPLSELLTPGDRVTNFSTQVKVGIDVLTKHGTRWVPANVIKMYSDNEVSDGDCAVQYFSDPKSASDGYSLQSVSYDILKSDAKYILQRKTVNRSRSSRRSIILFPRLTKYLSNV